MRAKIQSPNDRSRDPLGKLNNPSFWGARPGGCRSRNGCGLPRPGQLVPVLLPLPLLLIQALPGLRSNINASEAHNMSDERARSFRGAEFKRGAIAWGRHFFLKTIINNTHTKIQLQWKSVIALQWKKLPGRPQDPKRLILEARGAC